MIRLFAKLAFWFYQMFMRAQNWTFRRFTPLGLTLLSLAACAPESPSVDPQAPARPVWPPPPSAARYVYEMTLRSSAWHNAY